MLRDNINKEIASAMKSRDNDRLYVLKMIKAKFLEFKTSKGFNESDFTDSKEIAIIQKMVNAWQDEITSFKQANRDITEMQNRLNILKSFMPAEASDNDIIELIKSCGIEPKMQNMKAIMQIVQNKYPTATGKQISNIIKAF